ncbi:adhesion G-protein coupled receptor G6-like [Alosa alosa]|uniref:adhesion G-protein coupled receptor G6-like n=1 Tax=Alosa alosa TaxID=278164 RepID=UPI0020151547|nr:adhesion G-protein coupled receptor G6-like [Alosa alosa]
MEMVLGCIDSNESVIQGNLAAQFYKPKGSFNGLNFKAKKEMELSVDDPDSLVEVNLPPELLEEGEDNTIMFCMIDAVAQFEELSVSGGRIYGISICNKNISGLNQRVNITVSLPSADIRENKEPNCTFLDFSSNDFKTDGCLTQWNKAEEKVICSCNHLTYFAVLMELTQRGATLLTIQCGRASSHVADPLVTSSLSAAVLSLHFPRRLTAALLLSWRGPRWPFQPSTLYQAPGFEGGGQMKLHQRHSALSFHRPGQTGTGSAAARQPLLPRSVVLLCSRPSPLRHGRDEGLTPQMAMLSNSTQQTFLKAPANKPTRTGAHTARCLSNAPTSFKVQSSEGLSVEAAPPSQASSDVSMKIHMNLALALILLNAHFLSSPWAASLAPPGGCVYVAVMLHYSLLATFSWTAIEGFHLYLLLVRVFNIYVRRYLLKLGLLGWGVPTVVVSLVLIIDRSVYGLVTVIPPGNNTDTTLQMCYVSSDVVKLVTTVGGFALVFVCNLGVLAVTLRLMLQMRESESGAPSGEQRRRGRVCRDACSVMAISCMLGITWGLVLFSFSQLTLPGIYLFCTLNSFQGFFISIWFCVSRLSPNSKSENSTETHSMQG